MTNQDEPAYMLAARSNTRDGVPSSGYIVEKLLERIDRLEQDKRAIVAETGEIGEYAARKLGIETLG